MKENTDWHGCDGAAPGFSWQHPCPSVISVLIRRFFRYILPQRRKVRREKLSVAWRSELRFIFGVLCALRVSAVHLCTEVKRVFHRSGTAFTGFNPVQQVRPL
ncbi:hypothetical protein RoseRS_0462 [Roseiflexus sp. RS-1]|nr:hypothetical protein RoseRS_0462 [Roseiflexus sp. RS-1]